jgi:hypothetical protein
MIDIEGGTQAVGCAAEMVTLAVWGTGRVSSNAGAADFYDHTDVFRAAAALTRERGASVVGILIGSSRVRMCHVPNGCDPSVWMALSGGHWRVIANDSRIVSLPSTAGPVSSPCFPAIQLDGLPRSKTHGSCASIILVTVAHDAPKSTSDTILPPLPPPPHPPHPPPPPPHPPSPLLPLARIIGHRGSGKSKQLHVVWESGHAIQSAVLGVGSAGDDVDKWYVKT